MSNNKKPSNLNVKPRKSVTILDPRLEEAGTKNDAPPTPNPETGQALQASTKPKGESQKWAPKSSKVSPAPIVEPSATLRESEVAKIKEERTATPKSAGPLTVMPSKAAFTGGIAVSKTAKPKPEAPKSAPKPEVKSALKRRPSLRKTTELSPKPTHFIEDGIKAAASHYHAQKHHKAMYEVKMPRMPRYSERRVEPPEGAGTEKKQASNKVHINPRTLGSLVETLKAIYGTNLQAAKKRKKKMKKVGDSDSSDDQKGKKRELTDDGAEVLSTRLYGTQADVIKEFLDCRRDCERELIFKEATIPTWVKILWKFHFIYEFFVSCVLLCSVFYGLYAAIFRNHSSDVVALEMLSVLVECDVITRLVVEVWRNATKCQYEVFSVNYTFFLALLDLFASIPFPYYYMIFVNNRGATLDDLRALPLFALIKILHTFRMTKILTKLENDMNVRGHVKFFVCIIRYVIQYLLIVHILSCIIFWVGGKSYLDWLLNINPERASDKQYVTFLSIRNRLSTPPPEFHRLYPSPFGFYLLSLYLVVATISTVGFGDFFAVNNTERIIVIFMMLIGSIWISGELAYNLGTFFTDLDASRYMMFFRVKCIKIHLQNYQVSNFICKRTENYYRHLWRYRKGVHEIDLSYLPHCVQEELKFDICEEMFYKSPIFRGLDETFLMGLAKTAKVSLYSPGMILFERGSITKQMCFVVQGEVAVAAGLDDDYISAIHRAGCVIGEINLFMALPYEQTIYTRTVCTIMTITKKDLMLSLQDYPHIFAIMRERIKQRRERFRNAFNLVQVHPYVQWMYPKSLDELKSDPEYPVKVNHMKGWRNAPVTSFPMEDENEQVIIEMPCTRPDLKRIEALAYRLVSVPAIYYDSSYLLTMVNAAFLSLWLYMSWVTPTCWTFDEFDDTFFGGCSMISVYWPIIVLICLIDFVFELFMTCPSTGIYYKISDGLSVKIRTFGFYCDLFSIIPFEYLYSGWFSPVLRMLLKLWKIARFWDFLDERFPIKLFYIRIAKMTYYLLYLTFVIALFLICLACEPGRGRQCNDISFFNPSYPESRWQRVKSGLNLEQYILTTPIVYAASTITSVGFGNIFPQTSKEIVYIIIIMIIGHFFVSYILAQLTSALSARLTPKLLFHQKLLVVETFVRHNGLSLRLLRKLIEHYDLQHQYVSGCSLPEGTHLMYDAGKVLLEDVFLVEGEIFFDGVPAFSKIPSQAIIDMSRLMRRFVVPPDLVFVNRGEVRRVLYVIVNGSVALYQHGEKAASAVLTSTGHFGLRDLLFGEPYPYRVKTLSYVVLYAVDYSTFQEVLGDDEGLMEYINDEMSRREDEISTYLHTQIFDEAGPSQRESVPPSWIQYPDDPGAPIIGGDLTFDHFERPFLYFIGSSFIRERTMPDILHPAGLFGILWQAVMGLAAVATFMTLIMEMFMGYKGPSLRYFEFFLDLLFCADVYMKCHWAYYSYKDGEMRYHPVKTWTRYIFHGPFFIEIAMMIPLELILTVSGSTDLFGYGRGHSWYMKLRWIRFLRCYKFIELYVIVHRIFENRTTVMFLFYLSITVLLSFILAALAFFVACPTFGYSWSPGDEYKMPVCLKGTWVDHKAEEKFTLRKKYQPTDQRDKITDDDIFHARTFSERIVLGLYYVGQVLMVIGFGDLATFRRNELNFLTSVALFGFIVCQAIVSDITSAQIDTDEIRAINREKLERLGIALSREGASRHFTMYVRKAFRLSWSYAKGLQPNDLFGDLHPILHRELLREYIGDSLERVPIFVGFTDAFVNALKVKLKIEYYPKGSLVTRAGDLDYRMYIVVRGNLWVCDRDDRWLCTMSSGESIGEMSLVYAAKRRFTAYAGTNLQLLVLAAFDFAMLLEQYPLTRKDILRSLLQYKRESFLVKAWKWKTIDPEEYTREQEEHTNLVKEYFVQKLSHIQVRGNVKDSDKLEYATDPKWYQLFVGYGCEEITMHYIYFTSDSHQFNFVIHPSCKFMNHFRTLVQVVRFLAPMVALFHIFFYFDDYLDADVIYYTTIFGRIFDIILWLNIILRFFTALEVAERQTYCKDLKIIVTHYLFKPQGFAYDVFVCFPYDIVTGYKATPLMYSRCLLSIRFFTELWKLKDNIEVSTLLFKLITSVTFLLYLAHIMACVFFWLSCHDLGQNGQPIGTDWAKKCQKNGWVYKFRIEFGKTHGSLNSSATDPNSVKDLYEDPRPSHWYLISLYWVLAVLTTCGFGDITPTNFDEILLAVFGIFFGSLFLSILLGNITTGLSSGNKAKREYLGRVEKMLEYLEIIGLSNVGHQTLGAYCTMTWNNCRGVNYNDIADILPLYVQQDVYLALYHKYVTNTLFFGKDYDIAFVRAICPRLRHYMFLPGMRIVNELEPGTGIYIVMRGAVTSFQQNPETGKYEFIKRYEERQAFGRIPALYPGALYNKSYRAEEKTEVLLLYHADMRQLLQKFPKWRIFLKHMIAKEYSHFAKQTTLKNITERQLALDEKLCKDLSFSQFREAANLFAEPPPDRTTIKENKPVEPDPLHRPSTAASTLHEPSEQTEFDAKERMQDFIQDVQRGSIFSVPRSNIGSVSSHQTATSSINPRNTRRTK